MCSDYHVNVGTVCLGVVVDKIHEGIIGKHSRDIIREKVSLFSTYISDTFLTFLRLVKVEMWACKSVCYPINNERQKLPPPHHLFFWNNY